MFFPYFFYNFHYKRNWKGDNKLTAKNPYSNPYFATTDFKNFFICSFQVFMNSYNGLIVKS